jgi:hypothetical protein
MEAAYSSETLVYNQKTTWCNNPGDHILNSQCCENLKLYNTNFARFQVLTAASMKMAIFWVVVLCSLVEVY